MFNKKDVKLQKISLGQVTNELNFSNETLQSILKYNSKELQKSGIKMEIINKSEK